MRRLSQNKPRFAAIAGICILLAVTFLTPELTIRRYIFLHTHFIEAFTSEITKHGRVDEEYGVLYNVSGYTDRATGDEIGVIYVKHAGPFWYVGSAGSGL